MKRLATALAALGLTASAFAALPATTDPTLINVPQLPGGFVVGLTGYFLQPSDSNGDLDYASGNYTINANTFASELRDVQPGYSYGWGANVGYIFPHTGNDVNLSYLHLGTSDYDSIAGPGPDTISSVSSDVNPFFLPLGFTNANAKADYDLNQVDLTAGQYINVGCRLTLHPFAGLRWAQLDRKLNANYTGNVTTIVDGASAGLPVSVTGTIIQHNAASSSEKSDFQGIGPIAGSDVSYYLGYGVGIVGHADAALLIGNINSSLNLFNSANGTETFSSLVPPSSTSVSTNFSTQADNIRRIVPVMDAKLGVNYTYLFNNSANSDLTFEAGYQVSNYFNAVDLLHGILLGATPIMKNTAKTGSSDRIIFIPSVNNRTTSDMGINGPYVSVVLHV